MTTIIIVNAWIFTILAMYAFANVAFWLFAQAFGIVDNYLQNQYWKKWDLLLSCCVLGLFLIWFFM
jgi:hypothetical protein